MVSEVGHFALTSPFLRRLPEGFLPCTPQVARFSLLRGFDGSMGQGGHFRCLLFGMGTMMRARWAADGMLNRSFSVKLPYNSACGQ